MLEAIQRFGISQRTLYRLIEAHRERGIGAFLHAAQGRERGPQVAVTRAFDKAFLTAGGSEAELARLRDFVDERLCAEWAGKPGRAGWRFVAREVSTSLERMLPQLIGRRLSIPRKLFFLTRARADNPKFRELRQVDIQHHDAKRFHDTAPRISRDYSRLGIMDQVVCDVKNMDMKVRRADGTEGWPRLIGFMDMGTQRTFHHLVLNPEREGIRQEHIIEAFLDMISHPEWGFPRSLYRDNGSEFAAFDRIQSAMRQIAFPGKSPIISAIPYNSSAKPIEGFFSRMDRYATRTGLTHERYKRRAARTSENHLAKPGASTHVALNTPSIPVAVTNGTSSSLKWALPQLMRPRSSSRKLFRSPFVSQTR